MGADICYPPLNSRREWKPPHVAAFRPGIRSYPPLNSRREWKHAEVQAGVSAAAIRLPTLKFP